ncbi:MAG: Crp/Fnr family transcriptional regulator [Terriglobales bacterium]|jgi:CRP-like cAMP-binding protein
MDSESDGLIASPALREQLLLLSTTVSKPNGAVLFARGDPCTGAFLICKGKVRLSLDAKNAVFPARVLGTGCVVGLPSAVSGLAYSLTAEVLDEAVLACVSKEKLGAFLRQSSEMCMEVMRVLSHEISMTRAALKNGCIGV